MPSIYEKYNLKRVINASGKMTALGVSKYVDEAIAAQQFGGKNFFDMDQLNKNVGKYIANLLNTEDAQVVASAASGIALSVAALIGEGKQSHVHNPYSDKIAKREIIIPKGHNVDFGAPIELMIELGGGKVVEAGYANACSSAHIEEKINQNTVAILYVQSHHSVKKNMLSIEETIDMAKKYNLPVIVDAAAEQNLTKYLQLGANLVIYSGAKALEGTSSGFVVGDKQYIEWVRMQNNGIGRAMKIGKENILGLAAAIEYFINVGPESGSSMIKRLKPFLQDLQNINYVQSSMSKDSAGREIYRARITLDEKSTKTAQEVVDELISGSPSIYTRDYLLNEGIIEFDIRSVSVEEMNQIVDRLSQIIK